MTSCACLAVCDHGIPEELIADTFKQQRAFFELCIEQKLAVAADSNYRCDSGREHLWHAPLAAASLSWSVPRKTVPCSSIHHFRGYTPMAEETLDPGRSRRGDTHEGLYFGREVAADSPEAQLPLHGPNQWPAEELLPGYRATTEA